MVLDLVANCKKTLEIPSGKKMGETSKGTKIETIVLKASLVTRHSRDSTGLAYLVSRYLEASHPHDVFPCYATALVERS